MFIDADFCYWFCLSLNFRGCQCTISSASTYHPGLCLGFPGFQCLIDASRGELARRSFYGVLPSLHPMVSMMAVGRYALSMQLKDKIVECLDAWRQRLVN